MELGLPPPPDTHIDIHDTLESHRIHIRIHPTYLLPGAFFSRKELQPASQELNRNMDTAQA